VRTVTGGRVRWAAAAVCVADDDEQLAFFQSNLVPNKVTAAAAARWPDRRARELALREELQRREFPLVDKVPRRGEPTLTVARWGDGFSARFVVHRDAWRPEYVNVCLPFRRSAVGFDTDDLCLDLEIDVRTDGSTSWRTKDDDDLDERAELGIYTAREVARIRATAAEAVSRLQAGAPPFDGSWTRWSPDPGWRAHPGLPLNWADDLPSRSR
jgi:hypothetical protein